jgi:hypothetical protein
MQDKRNFPRSLVGLVAYIRIKDERINGKILDLTVEAILMEIGKEIPTGNNVAIAIKQSQEMEENELRAEVIRCIQSKSDSSKYDLVARIIEPNDQFLMDVLALVHGAGPKRDRRGTIYGER